MDDARSGQPADPPGPETARRWPGTTPGLDEPVPPAIPGVRLIRRIASGATSSVWSARTLADGQPRAVKITPLDAAAGPWQNPDELALGLARERLVLERAGSPHVLRLYDAVTIDWDGRPAVAFILDLAEGGSLERLVGARARLRPGEITGFMEPLTRALADLHARGIVHGDISPSNILFDGSGRPLFADFTTAHLPGQPQLVVAGTIGFVAPEVLAGADPSPATDVYAMGALMWFCRTGNGAPRTALRLDRATVQSHIGAELADLVARCIDPVPELRPPAADLACALAAVAAPEPLVVADVEDAADQLTRRIRAAARADAPPETAPEAARRGRRRRTVAILAGLVAAGILIGSLVANALGLGDNRAGSSPAPPSASAPATDALDATARQVLQQLVDGRAKALTARDVTLLDQVVVPDGPLGVDDRRSIAALQAAGARYDGLTFTVREVRQESTAPDRLVLRASIDVSSYQVVPAAASPTAPASATAPATPAGNASGATPTPAESAHPARPGTPLIYTVVRVDGQYRLLSVAAPPAS